MTDPAVAFLLAINVKIAKPPHIIAIPMIAIDVKTFPEWLKNIPNMISTVSSTLAAENLNIENMTNRSKGDFACTLADTNSEVSADVIAKINATEGIIRVIAIQ